VIDMTLGLLTTMVRIGVLGGFSIEAGGIPISGLVNGSQRLLILLALADRTVTRSAAANALWPDATPERAAVALRSALARLSPPVRDAVFAESASLALGRSVRVDLREARVLAHRILDTADLIELDGDIASDAIATLSSDLLPDWYDEWIVPLSDEWRHLRASALEAIAIRLHDAGRYGEAASAARAAVVADPLRETPHGILIRILMSEGNRASAIDVYENFRATLQGILDIEPTGQLTDLVHGIGPVGNEFAAG
jgi:DNA-binding SARP family transcriptional activator